MDKLELIDRAAVLEAVCATCDPECREYGCDLFDCCIKAAIYSVPTIDAAPVRRGEWIMIKGDSEIHKHNTLFECSKCGVLLTRCQSFCPNCGADMRKEDSNETNDSGDCREGARLLTAEVVELARGCANNDHSACYICPFGVYTPCNAALLITAADRLEELEAELAALKAQQRWIPVTEPPKEDEQVFAFCHGQVFVAYYYPGLGFISDETGHRLYDISHWMPLPEPPKEVE